MHLLIRIFRLLLARVKLVGGVASERSECFIGNTVRTINCRACEGDATGGS